MDAERRGRREELPTSDLGLCLNGVGCIVDDGIKPWVSRKGAKLSAASLLVFL